MVRWREIYIDMKIYMDTKKDVHVKIDVDMNGRGHENRRDITIDLDVKIEVHMK